MGEPNHSALIANPLVYQLIRDLLQELVNVGQAYNCNFEESFLDDVLEQYGAERGETPSMMYQDFQARRPMEVEIYLGSPIHMAKESRIPTPRLEVIYTFMHHLNQINQKMPTPNPVPLEANSPTLFGSHQASPRANSPAAQPENEKAPINTVNNYQPPPLPPVQTPNLQVSIPETGRPILNPPRQASGPRSMSQLRSLSDLNSANIPPRDPLPRHNSLEGLEQFADIVAFGDQLGGESPKRDHAYPSQLQRPPPPSSFPTPDNAAPRFQQRPRISPSYQSSTPPPSSNPVTNDFAMRERELALKAKELALRERELNLNAGRPRFREPFPNSRRPGPPSPIYDEDEEYDSYVQQPPLDENFDMMSVTSRRNRKAPQLRGQQQRQRITGGGDMDFVPKKSRTLRSASGPAASNYPPQANETFDPLASDPLNSYHSNRYPGVDTNHLIATSRANSLTTNDMRFLPRGPVPNRTNTGIDSRNAPPFGARNQGIRQFNSYDAPLQRPPIKESARSVTGSASASGHSANGTSGKSSSNSSFERNNMI